MCSAAFAPEPIRHLFVDEYQDINPAQERQIELLAVWPVELTVVGDDDQSLRTQRYTRRIQVGIRHGLM